VLDRSKAGDDGWLVLTGTEKLSADGIQRVAGGGAVEARKSSTGELEVKLPASDEVDVVLSAPR
jgi:hypothetical protein